MDQEKVKKWAGFIQTAMMEILTLDKKKMLHAANMLELAGREIKKDLTGG